MKYIRLDRLKLVNFKGISHLELSFGGPEMKVSVISGGNGVGKSTIKNAYLWCLFGITQNSKSSTVQPLDRKTNQVVHNLTTSVSLTLDVDGVKMNFRRELSEKWSVPKGKAEAVFKGTETSCYVNDVPLTVMKYNRKIEDILPMEKWIMLSNVGYFLALGQKDRRLRLDELCGSISNEALLFKYPAVAEAFKQNKTLDEFKRELAVSKSRAKIDLDQIPVRYDELEKLRVSIDRDALLSEQKVLEKQTEEAENELAGMQDSTISSLVEEIGMTRVAISKMESSARERHSVSLSLLDQTYEDLRRGWQNLKDEIEEKQRDYDKAVETAGLCMADIRNLGQKWKEENAKKPDFDSVETECPLCHRAFEESEIATKTEELVKAFNENKMKVLKDLEEKAVEKKTNLVKANGDISELSKTLDSLKADEQKFSEQVPKCYKRLRELMSGSPLAELEGNADYISLKKDLAEKESRRDSLAQEQHSAVDVKNRLAELKSALDDVKRKLAQEDVNARIDVKQAELEKAKTAVAQVLADVENKEQQVRRYEKSYIELLEDAVSSKFKIVRWKFYDRNITNDGEKEICEALVDGVPASSDNLNQGATINAGVDIINAFSKAYGVSVPLFVDCSESLEKCIETDCQMIFLEVVKGQRKLELLNYKS